MWGVPELRLADEADVEGELAQLSESERSAFISPVPKCQRPGHLQVPTELCALSTQAESKPYPSCRRSGERVYSDNLDGLTLSCAAKDF